MKKYLFTMVVMAIFAIGFAASDDSSSEPQNQETQAKTKKFFERGHTYVSNSRRVGDFNYTYVLTLYDDYSTKLVKDMKCINGMYNDEKDVYECSIEEFHESKYDVEKKWYRIDGEMKEKRRVITLIVDDKGRGVEIVLSKNDNGYDYVGQCDFTFRKQ